MYLYIGQLTKEDQQQYQIWFKKSNMCWHMKIAKKIDLACLKADIDKLAVDELEKSVTCFK